MARKQVIHDIDSDSDNDVVLQKMIETGIPLNLANYISLAYIGDPPEDIETDAEFLADVPEVILRSRKRVRR